MYRREFDGPAEQELASLPRHVKDSLAAFMEAAVIVDRWSTSATVTNPPTRPRPVRTLHFGPKDQGLVTFLVYPPGDLVLVIKIQWLGD